MKKMKVAISRENISTSLDIVQTCIDAKLDSDKSWSEVMSNMVAEKALEKYQGHIRAAFARAGVRIEEGETITVPVLLRVIEERTGLQINDLTEQGVMSAVDGHVSKGLSERLGVELPSVMGGVDVIKTALINAAKEAVASGRATKFMTAGLIHKIRTIKTFNSEGIETEEDRKKVMARIYQKRYRRRNKEVWDKE